MNPPGRHRRPSDPLKLRLLWSVAGLSLAGGMFLPFAAIASPSGPPPVTKQVMGTTTPSLLERQSPPPEASRGEHRSSEPSAPPVSQNPTSTPTLTNTPTPTPSPTPKPPPPEPPKPPPPPKPVAGLNQTQMNNAAVVVRVGKEMGFSTKGLVIAIATAMQESDLRNLANSTVPESLDLDNEGVARDHDSVGVFQQRPSTGWGTVEQCMDVEYSTGSFYRSLQKVNGWEDLPVTVAAQRVQGSAFPDAYAKHESRARQVVSALGG